MRRAAHSCAKVALVLGLTVPAQTVAGEGVAAAGRSFADHCFSPYLTATTARDAVAPTSGRIDFYDLRPFSSAALSPVTGRTATPGTDRRCEVSFDGRAPAKAADWIGVGLKQEGLTDRLVPVPDGFALLATTTFSGAAQLNPDRIAVVQAGVRDGANGPETYMSVERLTPLSEISQ